MYLSFKNFAGDFFYVVSFVIRQTTCVKAFGVTVLRGIMSRKTTVFNSYRTEDFKISNKKHAKKLLPVLELACVVYQTYFLIGTAHTDNW